LLACLAVLALGSTCLLACSGDDDDDDNGRDGGEGEADAAADSDAGADPDAGDPPQGCAEPDTECPADQPVPSGPCEGTLSCDYLDGNGVDHWTYQCAGGHWVADVECNLDGGCPVPPLAELCLDPFTGTLDGATVTLGPADVAQPFRALTEADELRLVVGAQGGSMVSFRLAVQGVDAPACIGATLTVTADGVQAQPQTTRVALHCGVSLPVFAILPSEYCEAGSFPLEIDLQIEGIGSAHAVLGFRSEGMCVG